MMLDTVLIYHSYQYVQCLLYWDQTDICRMVTIFGEPHIINSATKA
jgi:hypothetical protein